MSADGMTRNGQARPHVAVIGGGATGMGVARDLVLRGLAVTLIEQGDLGSGTSSRFHGMLQSGARYAVSDTEYAAECMRERLIVARLIPGAVEPVSGLFVSLADDDPDYADKFLGSCAQAQIPAEVVPVARLLDEEPALTRNVKRAFAVPDASINPWHLVNAMAKDIVARGGTILTRHRVESLSRMPGGGIRIVAAGEAATRMIESDLMVNAAGPWSARVAGLLGMSVSLELGKGSILVLARRLVGRIVNRCRYPASHDIIVPTGTVSLFGTTSEVVDDPSTTSVRPEEIRELLDGAEPLIPSIRQQTVLRVWAGVRPLVKPEGWPSGRSLPRRHQVVDHAEDGMDHMFTVCGGSLSTHRSMAEDVSNRVCARLAWGAPCLSATTPIEPASRSYWTPSASFDQAEADAERPQQLCECEAVATSTVKNLIGEGHIRMHDIRRRSRVGFGPCQGTFCGPRLADLLARPSAPHATHKELGDFWDERLKGMSKVAWGKQARQVLLCDRIRTHLVGLGSEAVNSS